jgi:hypothetical protein
MRVNTTTVAEPRTAAALAARHRSTEAAIGRVREAITQLRRKKTQVSVAAVARQANVSRTFLYDNAEARTAVAAAMTEAGNRRTHVLADQNDEREATWRERALNAEDAIKAVPRPKFSPNDPASENSSARSAICKSNGPKKPFNGSPPRTPPSNSESVSSPPTTAPSTNDSKQPAPTCASKTDASPTSKPARPNRSPMIDSIRSSNCQEYRRCGQDQDPVWGLG